MDAREAAAWAVAVAKDHDPEDLARLADLVGCQGLRDRADQTELRGTAIRAMEYCGDFSELPWLAQVGTAGNDDEARAAAFLATRAVESHANAVGGVDQAHQFRTVFDGPARRD